MLDTGRMLDELKNGVSEHPELVKWTALYADLLRAQSRAGVGVYPAAVDAGALRTRMESGMPLLAPEELQIDQARFARLSRELCAIIARHRNDLGIQADAVRARLDEDLARNDFWASLLRDDCAREGEEDGQDEPLLAFVLAQALRPFLWPHVKTLLPLVGDAAWFRAQCPICGGVPDFAALSKPNGTRRLLCSRCDAEWSYARTGCPFCGGDDPALQKYSASEDGAYRLYHCEDCGRYLKVIDLRLVAGDRLLPVERILTMEMDIAALKAGYSAPSPCR